MKLHAFDYETRTLGDSALKTVVEFCAATEISCKQYTIFLIVRGGNGYRLFKCWSLQRTRSSLAELVQPPGDNSMLVSNCYKMLPKRK
jgi:hypothetical protein